MGRNEALNFDHVALRSFNISRDVEWYTQKFGCIVEYQDQTWALLSSKNNVKIALVHNESVHPPHIAFLQETSPSKEAKMHRDGTLSEYIEDPSGNTVELLWRNSALVDGL